MRFEPLRTVYGHHPHLVAGDFHVALHFGIGRAQPGHEALQRRRLAPLIGQCEIEEFVERVIRLGSEPREDALSCAARSEQTRVEGERTVAQSGVA